MSIQEVLNDQSKFVYCVTVIMLTSIFEIYCGFLSAISVI